MIQCTSYYSISFVEIPWDRNSHKSPWVGPEECILIFRSKSNELAIFQNDFKFDSLSLAGTKFNYFFLSYSSYGISTVPASSFCDCKIAWTMFWRI